MKDWNLAALHAAAEIGAVCVVEIRPSQLRPGDIVFWSGRWRVVDHSSSYRMKENRKVYMSATGYHGQSFIKRFDIPFNENLLKKVMK